MQALCHCNDCRKITGSTFSTNIFAPTADLSLVSGAPKTMSKRTDKGNTITSYFCGECGTTLWRESDGIEAGVLDEMSDRRPPDQELYSDRRAAWLPAIEGAEQKKSTD
ncbi:MAG: hypothetical protein L6R35_005056 [Caloplaca aegaea]|nr:MAG: hypothetical protein L6R35_005056 [Caloplaca aegaea]